MKEELSERFPTGKYQVPDSISDSFVESAIAEIAQFPSRLTELVSPLNDTDLAYRYREHGWSIRQLVHHCADSHINAFIRFRKSLTENNPAITGYLEADWAELADMKGDVQPSLHILTGLHHRWVAMLKDISLDTLNACGYFHPEQNRVVPLSEAVGLYAWHGNHHLAHIRLALEKQL